MPRRRRPLERKEVRSEGDARYVYRFVHTPQLGDRSLVGDFASDAARGKPRRGRAREIPQIHDGMSAFRTLEHARARWRRIAEYVAALPGDQTPIIGDFVARVELRTGEGFAYEDLGDEDGHMTVWGDPVKLAAAVDDIVPVRE